MKSIRIQNPPIDTFNALYLLNGPRNQVVIYILEVYLNIRRHSLALGYRMYILGRVETTGCTR